MHGPALHTPIPFHPKRFHIFFKITRHVTMTPQPSAPTLRTSLGPRPVITFPFLINFLDAKLEIKHHNYCLKTRSPCWFRHSCGIVLVIAGRKHTFPPGFFYVRPAGGRCRPGFLTIFWSSHFQLAENAVILREFSDRRISHFASRGGPPWPPCNPHFPKSPDLINIYI